MNNNIQNIFDSIATDDKQKGVVNFGAAIREKLSDALEVRKIGLTTDIFNKTQEEEK